MAPLFAFFRLHWAWLRWVLLGLTILLALLTISQLTSYATAWLARHTLRQQQEQASAAHARAQAASAVRHASYQLDSTRLATHRQYLSQALTKLQQADDSLTRRRPARVSLPADPPRQ